MRAIAELKAKPHDAWRVCSGHDLTAILGRALLTLFGTHSAQTTKREEIESKLRMAFSGEGLRVTRLFHAVVQWEDANQPFLVWRQSIRVYGVASAIAKASRNGDQQCEVHVLRNVSGEPGNAHDVEFGRNKSGEVAACVKQRPAACFWAVRAR